MTTLDLMLLESPELDYKLEVPSTEKLARLFVAMANGKGGRVVVGVREIAKRREVAGVCPDQRVEEHIANVAAEVCSPVIEYSIAYETLENKALLILDIVAGASKPYFVKKLGLHQGTFIRVGSTCRLCDIETLQRLIREGKNGSFDSESSQILKSKIDTKLVENYLVKRAERFGTPRRRIDDRLLSDLDLVRGKKLSVAGALVFCSEPQADPLLNFSLIRAGRFDGVERGKFLDNQEIHGDLASQIEQAVKFIIRNISQRAIRVGLQRQESSDYPIEILREIVTNAVVHRDYSVRNESIQLAIFDDRIEVSSPGGLPGTLTVDNFINRQHSRNPIIAKRLFEMGYLEAWGLGIDTIVGWSKDARRRAPLFLDDGHQFTCVVFATLDQSKKVATDGPGLSAQEKQVLAIIRSQGSASNSELREQASLSKTQVHTLLCKLVKRKLIKKKGRGPATRYS